MPELESVEGRVIVYANTDEKNWHTFENGHQIRLERDVKNFNKRETQAVNATVISARYIPAGAEVLVHHNAFHPVNEIFNYKNVSGDDIASQIRYFSLSEDQVYVWRMRPEDPWQASYGFAIGLRVYQPYQGEIVGILPTKIKNRLYITSGGLKDQVVMTLKASDYEVVFQDSFKKADGTIIRREGRLIRCRHFEDRDDHDRQEIIAIDHAMTELVNQKKLHVGLSREQAKALDTPTFHVEGYDNQGLTENINMN